MEKIAQAFGIHAMHIESREELSDVVREVFDFEGSVVCTVKADKDKEPDRVKIMCVRNWDWENDLTESRR